MKEKERERERERQRERERVLFVCVSFGCLASTKKGAYVGCDLLTVDVRPASRLINGRIAETEHTTQQQLSAWFVI